MLLTIGSGVGLLSFAALAADYLLMSLKKEKKIYQSKIIYDAETMYSKSVQVDRDLLPSSLTTSSNSLAEINLETYKIDNIVRL